MTNTTLISRVLAICGEGHEDWTTQARAAIRETAIQLIKSGSYSTLDYNGLLVEKTVACGVTTALVPYSTMVPTGYEIIDWIEIIKDPTSGDDAKVQLLSYNEYMAVTLNPNLIRSGQIYAYITYTTVPTMTFSVAFAAVTDNLKYKALMWWDAILTSTALELSTYFSDGFLNALIELSAQRLLRDINA